MQTNDWIFTCKMKPLQFLEYTGDNAFRTIDKSEHSITHCGLKKVSNDYAQWFINNEIWKAYDDLSNYSNLSSFKRICKYHYIKTNGILEFHYMRSKCTFKKSKPKSSYKGIFYEKWLIYKGIRLELKDKYDVWDLYEQYVKIKCKIDNLKYEGY